PKRNRSARGSEQTRGHLRAPIRARNCGRLTLRAITPKARGNANPRRDLGAYGGAIESHRRVRSSSKNRATFTSKALAILPQRDDRGVALTQLQTADIASIHAENVRLNL